MINYRNFGAFMSMILYELNSNNHFGQDVIDIDHLSGAAPRMNT